MTKQHFEQAAKIVSVQEHLSVAERRQIADAFAMLFQNNNPRFDKDRFLVACNLTAPPPPKRSAKRRCTGDPFTID